MTYRYQAPERLERDWEQDRETPPDVMMEELRGDIENLRSMVGRGVSVVPVQGRVSDYKSWLAAATAMELSGDGTEVTVFAPQRTNRRSAVQKLRLFGADLVEHPGRIDLCVWRPWRENVGHVDKATCESIGCPFYLDDENDIASRTDEAVSGHVLRMGGDIDLDTKEMKELGRSQDFCPAQLYLHVRGTDATAESVNVATYAKAFADAAIADDDPLDSDVLLLDEAHTVAADPDVVADDVDPRALLSDIEEVTDYLDGSGERWAQTARRELQQLHQSVEHWLERSLETHVSPNGVFAGDTMDLADAFETLDTVEGRMTQAMRRRIQSASWEDVTETAGPYLSVGSVRSFLSRVKSYRDGDADFIHSLYEENGQTVNEMAFRAVDGDATGGGTTPGAVYRAWENSGTHPDIRKRWGPLLDRYIESLWDGRSLRTAGDNPGAPVMPMERLRSISGADTVVTLSASHNELSDPTREDDRLRPTRHRLLAAPILLRASGSERDDYDGRNSVTPETPWFRDMVRMAAGSSGDSLAAVPINYSNATMWEGMPVETLVNDDGERVHGIVPNSRGAIGEKGLEDRDIDTVACGVQVQSPAPTARLLVNWWEMLAPRHSDPGDVLEVSWRLLAQHAVSGTIQAGGRFDWDATNLVFERPGLVRLAGFEIEEATPDSPGFAGEFCRLYERTDGEWSDRRDVTRAARVVGYLRDADRKAPSIGQVVSEYQRFYDADEPEARDALRMASDRGRIGAERTNRGLRLRINER